MKVLQNYCMSLHYFTRLLLRNLKHCAGKRHRTLWKTVSALGVTDLCFVMTCIRFDDEFQDAFVTYSSSFINKRNALTHVLYSTGCFRGNSYLRINKTWCLWRSVFMSHQYHPSPALLKQKTLISNSWDHLFSYSSTAFPDCQLGVLDGKNKTKNKYGIQDSFVIRDTAVSDTSSLSVSIIEKKDIVR